MIETYFATVYGPVKRSASREHMTQITGEHKGEYPADCVQ